MRQPASHREVRAWAHAFASYVEGCPKGDHWDFDGLKIPSKGSSIDSLCHAVVEAQDVERGLTNDPAVVARAAELRDRMGESYGMLVRKPVEVWP